MIIAALAISLTLMLGIVCSVFAQSDDISSVLDKAQKSLDTQQSQSASKHDTTLSEGFKIFENKKFGIKMQHPSDWYYDEKVGPVDGSPDQIFSVSFTSPPNKDIVDVVYFWFTIEKLKAKTSLEEQKNTVYNNLNKYPEITQKIVQTPIQSIGTSCISNRLFFPWIRTKLH